MNYEVLKELRDERRRRHMGRGGKINPTPQYRKPHRESVGEEPKRNQNVFLPSEEIKVDERGSVKERKIGLKFEKGENRGVKRKLNEEIWWLLDRDYTYRDIAKELNINKMTVFRHKKLYGRLE